MTLRVLMKSAERAEILIYGDIGDSWDGPGITARALADELKRVSATALDVRINSYGGDVFEGLAIYSQLVASKKTVTVYVDGIAASAASVIAMAGDVIRVAEAGFVMIHDAWTFAMGNADDLRAVADRVDATSGQIATVYAARTKKSATEVRDLMRAETWFSGVEAVDAGLADEVVANKAIAAKFDPRRMTFRNLPHVLSPRRQALADQVARQAAKLTLRAA